MSSKRRYYPPTEDQTQQPTQNPIANQPYTSSPGFIPSNPNNVANVNQFTPVNQPVASPFGQPVTATTSGGLTSPFQTAPTHPQTYDQHQG
jgi:hypothetical protein